MQIMLSLRSPGCAWMRIIVSLEGVSLEGPSPEGLRSWFEVAGGSPRSGMVLALSPVGRQTLGIASDA